jgi:hypothetical protein
MNFFDTKALATNRHQVPQRSINALSYTHQFNDGFTQKVVLHTPLITRSSTVNHAESVFIENKRYSSEQAQLATW